MKFSCTKENLNKGLAIVSHIGSKNVNLPILNNVLVKTDSGGVKLVSTNLEMAITCSVRAKIEQNGEYTVPSKLFYDFINLLPNDRVDVDLYDDGLFIKSGSAKTKIKGISSAEFPLVPPVEGDVSYKIPVNLLKKALNQVLFATSTNESRPELTGVLFDFNGNNEKGLVLAATDSYRLSESTQKISFEGEEKKIIIPQKTLIELNRIFTVLKDDVEAPDYVLLEFSANQVIFKYGNVELISRLIEGVYPDYRQIIPKDFKTEALVDKNELRQAIKSASLFAKSGLFDIHLKFDPDKGEVELFAADSGRGENRVALKADIQGISNEITMNYRYILDGLGAIDDEKIKIKVIDGASPCFFEASQKMANENFFYIVMPIRS